MDLEEDASVFADLLNSNNYLSINISLIQRVGSLSAAVYLSELLNILKKAKLKGKMVDGNYVKVDRRFISSRTLITPEAQREIDESLGKLDLIEVSEKSKDVISVNSLGIVSLIALDSDECDKETLAALKATFKAKTQAEGNAFKVKAVSKALKRTVVTGNTYIRSLMNAWIDALLERTALTKEDVRAFQDKVLTYSSDVNVVKEVLEIAISNRYAYGDVAIAEYEKSRKNATTSVRVTSQRKATAEDLEKGVLF